MNKQLFILALSIIHGAALAITIIYGYIPTVQHNQNNNYYNVVADSSTYINQSHYWDSLFECEYAAMIVTTKIIIMDPNCQLSWPIQTILRASIGTCGQSDHFPQIFGPNEVDRQMQLLNPPRSVMVNDDDCAVQDSPVQNDMPFLIWITCVICLSFLYWSYNIVNMRTPIIQELQVISNV